MVTGIVTAEDDKSLTIRTATETVVLPKDEIDERELSDTSMMPDDQLKQFSTHEILSLFAYLRGKAQVPMLATKDNAEPVLQRPRPDRLDGDSQLWSVENGEIVGRSPGLTHNTFLVSDLAAEDFRLSLEVKLVERRRQQRRAVPLRAAQGLRGNARLPGRHRRRLVGQAVRRERPGAVVGQVRAKQHVKKGDWNRYEIEADRQPHPHLDQRPAVRRPGRPDGKRRGIIALQLHSGGADGSAVPEFEAGSEVARRTCIRALRLLALSSDAAGSSRNSVHCLCCCRIDAGTCGVTSPSTALRTASALRSSGTVQMIAALFMICRTLIEIACLGTSSNVGNQPSPSCCRRQASSSWTTRYGSSVSKSAGGSLNARWPFSPMPTNATSIGCRRMISPTRRHSACGSLLAVEIVERPQRQRQPADEPLPQVAAERGRVRDRQADVFIQVKPGHPVPVDVRLRAPAAASISNCDAPVATMMLAAPRSAIASRISAAPAAAAAFPICALSGIISMSIDVAFCRS